MSGVGDDSEGRGGDLFHWQRIWDSGITSSQLENIYKGFPIIPHGLGGVVDKMPLV